MIAEAGYARSVMKRLIIKHKEKLTPETARKQFEELYLGMDRPRLY